MSTRTALSRPRLAQGTLLLASMLTIMAGATIAPALVVIEQRFSTAPNAEILVGLVLTMHGLFITICSPIMGVLADRYGRRWVLLGSTVVYAIAGGSGLVVDSLIGILAGRAVLGVAVAGVMVTVTALISDYYDERKRETVLGRQGAFMSLGGVVLLPLAGVLADIGWRVPFLVYTLALVLLPAMAIALPEPKTHESTPEAVDSNHKRTGAFPLGTLGVIVALGLVGQIFFYMIPVQLPFYLETQAGANGSLIGTVLAVSAGAGGIASLLYGRLRRTLRVLDIVVLTFGLMGVGYAVIGTNDPPRYRHGRRNRRLWQWVSHHES
ncbi:MFS transporter [Halocatena halophila]|uniref:MFS transporter n=1 Tax=Halocatena halophila TaxID=2814576 RepID=UPI002ED35620